MGLNTTHGCFDGGYGEFGCWRDVLTEVAGMAELVARTYPDAAYDGRWKSPPEDPLLVLLIHSDCSGVILPEHASPLADRLEGLLPALMLREGVWRDGEGTVWSLERVIEHINYKGWPPGIHAAPISPSSAFYALRFAIGLRKAAARGEQVVFF